MRESDERLLQAIRVGNIGIFDHDHEADTIYWSPELRAMYGWDADEPATLPKIVAQVHPEDVERVVAAVRRDDRAVGRELAQALAKARSVHGGRHRFARGQRWSGRSRRRAQVSTVLDR